MKNAIHVVNENEWTRWRSLCLRKHDFPNVNIDMTKKLLLVRQIKIDLRGSFNHFFVSQLPLSAFIEKKMFCCGKYFYHHLILRTFAARFILNFGTSLISLQFIPSQDMAQCLQMFTCHTFSFSRCGISLVRRQTKCSNITIVLLK